MTYEISKEDLFKKIDTLKIKCFDAEDALKSAETRIQELNKCNDYANEEIERLNKKIEQYENPEDMTLMFMWCDEKAKDEIKRLNHIINELENWLAKEYISGNYEELYRIGLQDSYDKLQELKGSNKE